MKQFEAALSAPVRAEAAILYDYDSLASFRIQRQSLLLEPEREMKRLHGLLHRSGVGVDVIPASRDFSGYKLVIVPNMAVTDPDFTARLKAYVASGGVALVTFRTAVKDRDNNLVFGKSLPVDLTDMLGLCVVETESLQEPDAVPLAGESGRGTAGVFRDMIVPEGAHVLWRYDDEFYRPYAAVTRCDYGLGAAYYLGTVPDAAVLDTLFGELMSRAVLERLELPEFIGGKKHYVALRTPIIERIHPETRPCDEIFAGLAEACGVGEYFDFTVEELADKLGLPKDTFTATVDRYNELAAKGEDKDYGKEDYRLSTLSEAPFYGVRQAGGYLICTIDGIQIDDNMHAIDQDFKAIPGLYVIGDMSGNYFSGSYPSLMAGAAAGRSATFGRFAGQNAAAGI